MFELRIESNTPLSSVDDIDIVAETFLTQIGYIPKGYDPKTDASNIRDSVPYRLFMNHFMKNMSKAWTVEELAALLSTTKPTVYRHINKLKSMDLLESMDVEFEGQIRKGYRIRFGDLTKAWTWTETNVTTAMESYRKSVDHFQKLANAQKEQL